MNKSIIVGISLGLVFGIVAYISSDNILISAIVLALTIAYFTLVISKRFEKHNLKIARFHECYHFINNFIVCLSIKKSVVASIEHATSGASEEFKEFMESISNLSENDKLIYLRKYFTFNSYHLFSDIVLLWCEEGGDVLSKTNYLSNNLRLEEEYISFSENESKKKMVEFSILWIFSLTILFVLRFVLSQFYSLLTKQPVYLISILIFFLVLLGSVELLTRRMTQVEIKGWKNERK